MRGATRSRRSDGAADSRAPRRRTSSESARTPRCSPSIVAGHHDGWFRAAFDDASAVADDLALARAFAEKNGRPSGRSSSSRTPRRSTGSRTRRTTGATALVPDRRGASESGRRTQPSICNIEGSGSPRSFTRRHASRATPVDPGGSPPRRARRLLPHGYRLAAPTTWTEVLAVSRPRAFRDQRLDFSRTAFDRADTTPSTTRRRVTSTTSRVCGGLRALAA